MIFFIILHCLIINTCLIIYFKLSRVFLVTIVFKFIKNCKYLIIHFFVSSTMVIKNKESSHRMYFVGFYTFIHFDRNKFTCAYRISHEDLCNTKLFALLYYVNLFGTHCVYILHILDSE